MGRNATGSKVGKASPVGLAALTARAPSGRTSACANANLRGIKTKARHLQSVGAWRPIGPERSRRHERSWSGDLRHRRSLRRRLSHLRRRGRPSHHRRRLRRRRPWSRCSAPPASASPRAGADLRAHHHPGRRERGEANDGEGEALRVAPQLQAPIECRVTAAVQLVGQKVQTRPHLFDLFPEGPHPRGSVAGVDRACAPIGGWRVG